MAERKPHIFIEGHAQSEAFQSRNIGRSSPPPQQDRKSQGRLLSSQYSRLLAESENRGARTGPAITAEEGIYVEITSFPGYPLPLAKLDNRDFQLRAFKTVDDRETATVFIPESRRHAFKGKIDAYLNPEKDNKNGNPRNYSLINCISEIKLADLKAFWTDSPNRYPEEKTQSIWWELWLKPSSEPFTTKEIATQLAERIGAKIGNTSQSFFNSHIYLIQASINQLESAPELIANLEEVRKAKETPRVFINMSPTEQQEWADDLADRIKIHEKVETAISILDTGVNYNHPILKKFTSDKNSECWLPGWPKYDDFSPHTPYNDHGSRQAGLAALGDLQDLLTSSLPVDLNYIIESGRIIPPTGHNDPELYGSLTTGTASKLEINNPDYKRVYSLAITSEEQEEISGQPSSWSAEVDQFSSGIDDNQQRLFIISAGNNIAISPDEDIWDQITLAKIQDPAQSWNALTVGAYTEKTTNDEPTLNGWSPLASTGDLSPSTRSSVLWGWAKQAPFKPDIVEEGGNRLLSPDKNEVTDDDVVSLLTTSGRTTGLIFERASDTSSACALTSRLAATLMAEYPEYWPETIRGLIVHSAEWTPRMCSGQVF